MSTPREGQRVAFCGDPDFGLQVGDRGKVLSCATDASHVLWATGSCAGEISLVTNLDLVVSGQARTYDDLDSQLVTISVRDTYDSSGDVGLLNALNEEGHLSTFTSIAEETMVLVASLIRQDPSVAEVLAHLDSDEGEDFVSFAASALLRDAFSQIEES